VEFHNLLKNLPILKKSYARFIGPNHTPHGTSWRQPCNTCILFVFKKNFYSQKRYI